MTFSSIISRYRQHPVFAYLLLLFTAWLWHHTQIAPTLTKISDKLRVYAGALQSDMPELTLEQGFLKMNGNLPVHILAADSVEAWFIHDPDTSLLKYSKRFSLVVSDTVVYIRGKQKIHQMLWRDVHIDAPKNITGVWVQTKTRVILWRWLVPIHLAALALLFLALLFFAASSAGAGLIIDAFNDGPLSFRTLFQYAAVLMWMVSWLMIGVMALGLKFSSIFIPFFIGSLSVMIAGTYFYIKNQPREVNA